MGLFDFVKEIGSKVFNRDEEADEKIMKHIEENNPGITGLGVSFSKGVVSFREVIKDANLIYPGQKIRIPLG